MTSYARSVSAFAAFLLVVALLSGAPPSRGVKPVTDSAPSEVEMCTTNAECDDLDICTVDLCEDSVCVVRPFTIYGDINRDGFASVNDALCVLDAFGGNPGSAACVDMTDGMPITPEEMDISPCPSAGDPFNTGNGFVSIDDTLTILDVFGCNCGNRSILGCFACNLAAVCPGCAP